MKNLFIVLVAFIVLPIVAGAQPQNMVNNGSFEDTIKCTNSFGFADCIDWELYTNGSADYYNSCKNVVPKNIGGYQYPAHGNAYCGLLTHMANVNTHYEYLAGKIQPLQPGVTYEVSISVNRSNTYSLATDNIGVYFYKDGPQKIATVNILPVTPQVYYSNYGIINDTLNWIRLTGNFTADSAYSNIVIGAFNNANNTYNVKTFSGNTSYAYYNIDSVVVKIYDSLSLAVTDTLLCAGDTIDINYFATKRKQSNNVFTIQLSNATGSFATPINIGALTHDTSGTIKCVIPTNTTIGSGYRMRIIASNFADTADAYYNIKIGSGAIAKPVAGSNGPICDNDKLTLTAKTSTAGVSYKWEGPVSFSSIEQNPTINSPLNSQTGKYIVTAYIYGCEAKDTTDVIISKIGDISYPVAISNQPVCVGDTLRLYSNTSNASTYSWAGPNNFSSSHKNPEFRNTVSTQSGLYILTATNNYCTLKDTVDVTVTAFPSKPEAVNNGPICTNGVIKLSAYSPTAGITYSWKGPNNYTSSQQDPTITNPTSAKEGDYIVTISLNGCESKDTTTVALYGGTGPDGLLATSNSPICIYDTLRLSASANGSGNTYSWTGPNGFNSTSQNPVKINASFTASGTYKLFVSNGGCAIGDIVNVVVNPRPKNVNASYNNPVCTGEPIKLAATSTSTGVTYQWRGPNNYNTSGQTPVITGTSSVLNGNYIVSAFLNGCPANDIVGVVVKPTPAAPTANNNSPICAGETLNLSATSSTSGVTYDWTGPNSFTSSTQNPSITNTTVAMSGNYIATAYLDGCGASTTTAVVIKPLPSAVTVSSNSPACEGGTLQLSSTASTNGVTYSWSGPNSFTAGTQNSSIANSTTAATGWYKMLVGLNGCFYEDSTQATVNVVPTKPVISYNSPLCVGETLTLNAGNITGASYSWTGANGYTSTQALATRSNMQTADVGVYKTTVTVNGCTSPEGTVTVNLNPTPFVVVFANPADSICKGDVALFTALPNNHGGAPSYQWLVNGQASGTGSTFNTTTLNDQDIISCDMTENTKCSVPYVDASNDITMTVLPWLAPSVSITANPTVPLKEHQYVTFTATPINAGINPGYQWKRNGQNIVGATGNVWSANSLNDNDVITVEVISKYKCPQPPTASSNSIKVRVLTDVKYLTKNDNLLLFPNPNNGNFTLSGHTVSSLETIQIEVLNNLGQVIYQGVIEPKEHQWTKEMNLDVPAGIYLLRLYNELMMETMKFNIRE